MNKREIRELALPFTAIMVLISLIFWHSEIATYVYGIVVTIATIISMNAAMEGNDDENG